jgi:hypothetical protein
MRELAIARAAEQEQLAFTASQLEPVEVAI